MTIMITDTDYNEMLLIKLQKCVAKTSVASTHATN
jgi:hypothetical protein